MIDEGGHWDHGMIMGDEGDGGHWNYWMIMGEGDFLGNPVDPRPLHRPCLIFSRSERRCSRDGHCPERFI